MILSLLSEQVLQVLCKGIGRSLLLLLLMETLWLLLLEGQ